MTEASSYIKDFNEYRPTDGSIQDKIERNNLEEYLKSGKNEL
jgi:hypothetical protein